MDIFLFNWKATLNFFVLYCFTQFNWEALVTVRIWWKEACDKILNRRPSEYHSSEAWRKVVCKKNSTWMSSILTVGLICIFVKKKSGVMVMWFNTTLKFQQYFSYIIAVSFIGGVSGVPRENHQLNNDRIGNVSESEIMIMC